MGLGREQESKLADSNLNLELEYNDVLKASKLTLKFVAFKTPTSGTTLPSSLFFTFKFFTYQAC